MIFETIRGDLRAHSELELGTLAHADDLMAEQTISPETQNEIFYVADGPIYTVKKGRPTLCLARYPDNLLLRHLTDTYNCSYNQLLRQDNYHPDRQEAECAMRAATTLQSDLTQIRLQDRDAQSGLLEIKIGADNDFNVEEIKLVERCFGQGTAFKRAMQTLKVAGITSTGIIILRPDYVERAAKSSPIVRAAWRNSFNCQAQVYLNDCLVAYPCSLRGRIRHQQVLQAAL